MRGVGLSAIVLILGLELCGGVRPHPSVYGLPLPGMLNATAWGILLAGLVGRTFAV